MSAIETLLLIVLAIILIAVLAWVALYALARNHARRYRDEAVRIRRLLDTIDAALAQHEIAAGQYAPDSPEPYGPLAQDLAARLQHARNEHRQCAVQFSRLEAAIPELPGQLIRRIAAVYWPYLRLWRQHLQQARLTALRAQGVQDQLARIAGLLDQLRGLPLDVAGRVRGLLGATDRIARIGQWLKESGARGDSLDATLAQADSFIAALRRLPDCFLQGADEVVMQRATQESTREAHTALRSIERPIYDTLRRLQTWQSQYTEARNMIGVMQLEISAAEKALRETPPRLDVANYTFELQQLRRTAQLIDDQQRAADVDALADLSNAATRQVMKARELATQVMALRMTYQSIEQAILANDQCLDRIGSLMDELARAPVCPVAWEHSAAERDRLLALRERIGGLDAPRNDSRLKSDLDKALELGLQARALEAQVKEARDLHGQLQALLRSDEARTRAEWLQETASVHIAAAQFAAENWPPGDAVLNLRADALALARREQGLTPLFDNRPIAESQARQWIDALTAYLRERRALSARLNRIDQILSAIQKQEQSARALLADTSRALEALNVEPGRLLPGASSAARWDELVEIWQRGRLLSELLDQRDTGKVSDKAVSIEAWSRQCLGAVSDLGAALRAECAQARAQLQSRVAAVTAIAPFDLESAMQAAQALVAAPDIVEAANTAPARQAGRAPAKLLSLPTRVEQANQAWAALSDLNSALTELESQIVARLDRRSARLEEARQQAWQQLRELERLRGQIPDIQPMPVTCADADQLAQDYEQAEASLEDLRQSGRTTRVVVARLDNLIQQHEYIANRGASLMGELERDILRLNDVWGQFSAWARALQRYRNQRKHDKPLAAAIDARFSEMEQRFESIRRRYRGRPLPVHSAWQELDALLRDMVRDIDVTRDGHADVVTVGMIEAGG